MLAWAELHQEELPANCRLVMNGEPPFKIQPLQSEEFVYPAISEVLANKDFSLSFVLETGEKRSLDMKPYLDFGVFKKPRDFERFKRVRIAFDTVEWDDGVDLDPEFVYQKSTSLKAA
jgi:hypothetical protein